MSRDILMAVDAVKILLLYFYTQYSVLLFVEILATDNSVVVATEAVRDCNINVKGTVKWAVK